MLRKIEISLLSFLLCLGVFVSSIGVTWCRYQVNYDEKVQFIVRKEGAYYVVPQQAAPTDLETDKDYEVSFSVWNTLNDEVPTTSHRFHVRWNSTTKQEVSLFLKELSGREKEYVGIMIQEVNGIFSYVFVDEDSKEALLIHEANEISEKQCRLVVKNPLESFGSEIIIIDDSYESEHQNTFTTHEVEDFSAASNLLSLEDNQIIEISDEIELTLSTNRDIKTRVSFINENEHITAALNDAESVEMEIKAGETGKAVLKLVKDEPVIEEPEAEEQETPELAEEPLETEEPVVTDDPENNQEVMVVIEEGPETSDEPVGTETPETSEEPEITESPVPTPTAEPSATPDSTPTPDPTETPAPTETPVPTEEPEVPVEPEVIETPVIVLWEILNEQGEVIEIYQSGFVLEKEKSFNEEANVTITSEKETFNQYEYLNLTLISDKDTDVLLSEQEGFPKYTKYSLDGGIMWFKMEDSGAISLNLKENQEQSLSIDFSETDLKFENRDYILSANVNETEKTQLNLKMEMKEAELFEVKDFKPFVLSNESFSLSLSLSDVTIWMERLVDGEYVWIDKDSYFNWTTEDFLTYQISGKEDTEIPNGNYRIVITQTVNNRTVKKEVLSLYAMGR